MIRSWKNKEFTSSLSNQELKDLYGCLAHHTTNPHTKRKYCCDGSTEVHPKEMINSRQCEHLGSCPCTCANSNDSNHFCTSNSIGYLYSGDCKCDNSAVSSNCCLKHENSIIVCENYAPSYTSKKDQIQFLKKEVGVLRRSKSTMQKAMDDLDKLLEESRSDRLEEMDEGETRDMNSVERFYRSKDFIGSSLNIKSLKDYVPRKDISRTCYEVEERDLKSKGEPVLGTPLFGFFNKNIFADPQILENELFKKNYGRRILDPSFKLKPKSAIIYNRKKI
jgi:hypothetical protein